MTGSESTAGNGAYEADDDPDESVCGLEYDHTEVIDYDGPDGVQWHCSNCGAEVWEDPEPTDANAPSRQVEP